MKNIDYKNGDESLLELLSTLRNKGIKLRVEGDRLRFSAPRGALTQDLRNAIADRKVEIIAFLGETDHSTDMESMAIEPVPRERELPLSFAQQRLWFLNQLVPESPAYNITEAIQIEGKLQIPVFRKTLNEIVKRHEILRTVFPEIKGKPIQAISSSIPLNLPVIDLQFLSSSEQEKEVQQIIISEARQPFFLTQGPLLRVTLLHLNPLKYIIILNIHHIISDAWSMGIFLREIAVLYDAYSHDRPSPLPDLAIQYADFAYWQRQWLQGEVLEKQLDYWRQQLANTPEILDLTTDKPRLPVQTFNGAQQHFALSGSLTGSLNTLSRQENVTLFMTLLAAFNVLLYRYTHQEDILVGTAVANRNRTEIENLIGFFINTLVLRTDLSGNPTFRQLLRRVREVTLDAYAHQDVPFEKLVSELQPERNLSHTPLFQVAFQLQNTQSHHQFNYPDLKFRSLEVKDNTTKFDLTLVLAERNNRLAGSFGYNTDLFYEDTITRMIEHFQNLLEGIAENPDRPLSDLPFLGSSERQKMLIEWNKTKTDISDLNCIHELFEVQAADKPDAVAVVFENTQLTYRVLNERSNRLAHYLQERGVGPEVMTGICVERSPEMILGILGILKAGGAYVPMDPDYPEERLQFMMEDLQVGIVLTQQHLISSGKFQNIENEIQFICLDADWELITGYSSKNTDSSVTYQNLAYVIYTSGSTGKPKGTLLQHRGLCNFILSYKQILNITSDDCWLQFFSFSFDGSLPEIFCSLAMGGKLCLVPRNTLLSGQDMVQVMYQQQITNSILPPSFLSVLPEADFPALQKLLSGGEACTLEIVKRWAPGRHFFNAYGPTETTVGPSIYFVNESSDIRANIPIGRPIANMRIYILDNRMQPVPIGIPGEIVIAGVGLARGYHKRPELTAEKFIPDPFSPETGDRLYRTGDKARFLANGNIEFLGRMDSQVKIRGYRIELREIEAVLNRHPQVKDSVVIAPPNKNQIFAFYTAKNEIPVSELRNYLRKQLPEYMMPAGFMQLEAFPLTPNGKTDRHALLNLGQVIPDRRKSFTPPRNLSEQILADAWREVLRVEQVGIHDNFFELGGDSMHIIQIIAHARQAGLDINPAQMIQNPTIAKISRVIGKTAGNRAEQGMVTGHVPLTPIQHWFFEQNLPDPHHWNWAFLREIREAVDPGKIALTIKHLLRHHDALRLRFIQNGTGWSQYISEDIENIPFSLIDLSLTDFSDHSQTITALSTALQESLNLSEGPLFRVVYFRMGENHSDRALIIFHHLVVDVISSRILMEDFLTIYQNLLQKKDVQIPPKTTSFKDWAEGLFKYAQSDDLRKELDSWLTAVEGNIQSIPIDLPGGKNTESSTEKIIEILSESQTNILLRDIPAGFGMKINELLLTALIRTFFNWTGKRKLLIAMEGHGREYILENVDVSRTVGWFTTTYPVLLDLGDSKTIPEEIENIKNTLVKIPHHGIGFGLLRYLTQDEEVQKKMRSLPEPDINFNYLGQLDQKLSEATPFMLANEDKGPERSMKGQRSFKIYIVGSVRAGKLRMHWNYSRNLHKYSTIEYLAKSYMEELRNIIDFCAASYRIKASV